MRFFFFASIVTVCLAACSSSSTTSGTSSRDSGADVASNPCGPGNRVSLPTCTAALEGTYCAYEACVCCANGATCESGNWVNPTTNDPNGSCTTDAGKHKDAAGVHDSGGTVDSGHGKDSSGAVDAGKVVDGATGADSSASDAAEDAGHFTCGDRPADSGPGNEQLGTCPGLAKCCPGGVPGSYYCYAGDGGCPEVP